MKDIIDDFGNDLLKALAKAVSRMPEGQAISKGAIRKFATRAITLAISNYDAALAEDIPTAERIAIIATEICDITASLLSLGVFDDPNLITIEATLMMPKDTDGAEDLEGVSIH